MKKDSKKIEILKKSNEGKLFFNKEFQYNKNTVMLVLKNDGSLLRYAPSQLRDDKEVVYEAVKNSLFAIEFASERLQNDFEILSAALKGRPVTDFIKKILKNNIELAYKLVESGIIFVCNLPEELKDNVELMTRFQKRGIDTLNDVTDKVKNDEEFAISAIKANSLDYYRIGEEVRDNERIILELLKTGTNEYSMYLATFLIYARNPKAAVLKDKDLMVEAVSISGTALRFLSDDLKDDYEVVYEAVNQNEEALDFASIRLQNNEILLKIIENKKKNKNR